MNIYLDTCCLNRPFDDQSQERIRLESEAVILILAHVQNHSWRWIGSDVLHYEVTQIADYERRYRILALMEHVDETASIDSAITERTIELEQLGFRTYDAMHIAAAEAINVDVFLTTDDRLLRLAARLESRIFVAVKNPLTWLSEDDHDS